MKNFKKIILIVCLLLTGVISLAGCTFLNTTVQTPTVTIDRNNQILNWTAVDNAESYEVYMDEKLIHTEPNKNVSSYNFNFASFIKDDEVHSFKVKAVAKGLYADSQFSRTLSYVGNLNYESANEKINISYSETLSPKNVKITNDIIEWDNVENITEYYVGIYTTTEGLNYYKAESNLMLLSTVVDEECAIRVGVKDSVENVVYLNQELIYYSPDISDNYTKEFYLFDSQLNDMYVTSIEELNNLVYYKFIYRDEDYKFRVSNKINTQLQTVYNLNGSFSDNVKNATTTAFSRFMETMDYEYNPNGRAAIIGTGTDYVDVNVKINFKGVKECDISLNATDILLQDNNVSLPYYEIHNGNPIGENIILADENWFLSAVVETSEQLYWAVENQIRPIFLNDTCRAKEIYDIAVNLLKSTIIKEGMSDYEKALAIFDWIEYNTKYDYTESGSQYENGVATGKYIYGNTITNAITSIPSYYLEGVFLKGVAVCDGFSKAYSLMCNLLNIECVRISGSIYSSGMYAGDHAWNKVKIGNQFYICDITWTPITYDSNKDYKEDVEYLSHKYFMVNDEFLEQTHREFQYRTKYFSTYYDAPNMYSYYTDVIGTHYVSATDSTGVLIDRIITSTDDLNYTFKFMFNNKIESLEIVFTVDYYETIGNTDFNTTRFTETLKNSKIKCQYLQTMGMNVAWYGDNLKEDQGYLMLLSSTNLIDDTGEVDGEDDIIEIIQHLNNTGSEYKYETYDIWVDKIVLEDYLQDGVSYAEAINNWVNYLKQNIYNDTNYEGLTYTNFEIVFDESVNNGNPIIYELNDTDNTAYACTFKLTA